MNILFINACVRQNSRTKRLADHLLALVEGEITEVCLEKEDLQPLSRGLLKKRDELLSERFYDHPMFRYATQFAEADLIVIAAPYWDLAFPSLLKIYLESITVTGITFCYDQGISKGLCRAKRLIYVTTSGGPIFSDFGYSYVKTLAETFYGIPETVCYKAENLDVYGADVEMILKRVEEEIITKEK